MRVPLTGRPSNHDEWEVVGKRYLSETSLAIFHQPGDQPQLNVAAHAALTALLDTAEPQVKRLVYLDHRGTLANRGMANHAPPP